MQSGAAAHGPTPPPQYLPAVHGDFVPAEQQNPLGQERAQSVYPSTPQKPSVQAVTTEFEVLLYPAGVGIQIPV